MVKKILAITIIASMLLGVFIGVVNADEGVETIDALNEAIVAGGTVTLANDIEGEIVIPEGVTVTLNLAGFELKSTLGDTISNHGTLTITGDGKVTSTANGKGAIVNYSDGNVTIENGTIYAESWYSIKNMGTMKILDGNISKGTNGASVIANGWYGSLATDRNTTGQADTAKLTIEGGYFSGDGQSSTVIKNDDYGILVINGGELVSSSEITDINAGPVILNWHDATINGGTLISTNGAVLANGYLSDDADKGTLNVNGGIFISGTNAELLAICGGAINGKGELTIEDGNFAGKFEGNTAYSVAIKGGNFSEQVPEDKLDESLIVELKKTGEQEYPYSYYTSVEAAMEVAEVGDEIDGEVVVAAEYTITLDYAQEGVENTEIVATENEEIELPEAEREGYIFKGWRKDEETIYEAGSIITAEEDITLTAEWEEIVKEYTLIFKDGYTENDEGIEIKVKAGDEVNAPTLTREGYNFDKWTPELPTVFEVQLNEEEEEIEEYIYTAEWTKKSNSGNGGNTGHTDDNQDEEWENPYNDVKEDKWYFESVKKATQSKLFNGMTASEFMPEETLTRGMAVTVLYRLAGANEEGKAEFDDVEEDAYYSKAVAWAAKNKIVFGTGNNKFEPNEKITRQDLATMLYRYVKMLGKGYEEGRVLELNYEDKNQISDYAIEAISWCTANNIIEGKNENIVDPKANATRAEAAKIFILLQETIK